MVMKLITIFKPGLVNYTDHGLDKPVRFTEEFLKEIAATTPRVRVTDEHDKVILSELRNFVYQDGCLQVQTPLDLEIKGKGMSPVFEDMDLVEYDDYYLPVSGRLREVGLTRTPRNQILYNSIKKDDKNNGLEDDKLADNSEVLEKALAKQQEQQEEIGILKSQLKNANKSAEETQKLQAQLAEAETEKEKVEGEIEAYKKKADKYDEIEDRKKKKIIKEMAGKDEELRKELSEMSLQKLEFFKEHEVITQKPKGVVAGGAPGSDDDGTKSGGSDEPVDFLEIRNKMKNW